MASIRFPIFIMFLILVKDVWTTNVVISVFHVAYSQQSRLTAYAYLGETIIDDGKTCDQLIDVLYSRGWYRSGAHTVVSPNPDPRRQPSYREVPRDEVFNYDAGKNAKLSYTSINSEQRFRAKKIKRMIDFEAVLVVHNDQ
ncbi:hypothetical protein DdX_17189 [Ditylenchus destructor]|uniref:Uncharacterized protein n=1 Tax=Ditylenchus destructor TaxID=166010 RepID=A0AAD4MN76_9BILA|nr:hypothetical protein DdX_17189 [Ditylenchus destructor]